MAEIVRNVAKKVHENFDDPTKSHEDSLIIPKADNLWEDFYKPRAAQSSNPDVKALMQHGYVILPNLITKQKCQECRDTIAYLSGSSGGKDAGPQLGRNNFEGRKTERIYALPAKSRAFDALIEHPRILAVLDELMMPNPLLSAMQSINIHPGETPQNPHTDDQFIPEAYPRRFQGLATVWALTDFTDTNGATMVVPESHLWGGVVPSGFDWESHGKPAVMEAGSCVLFLSSLWHFGGKNVTKSKVREAVTFQYCEPYLRPQENIQLALTMDVVKTMSPKMQSLCGFSIHPPFIGHSDGISPLKSKWTKLVPKL